MKHNDPWLAAVTTAAMVAMSSVAAVAHALPDPLPSWNDGAAKQSILSFVRQATDTSGPNYVKIEDRIAAFDQDGTLWVEHPVYTQAMFALDRVRDLAPTHPEWKEQEPFKAVIAGEHEAIAEFTEQEWMRIVAVTHAGISTEAFLEIVRQWLTTAKHPRFQRPYTDLAYQPMREVIDYLRGNGFKTYIVTGGGQEFVRAFAEPVYGVPPEQVIGTAGKVKYAYDKEGGPMLVKLPEVLLIDDKAGKPEGINLIVGRRPYAAFGNSTGDQQMLEWTQAGLGARLMMLVYHDDTEREYAYGPAGGLPETKVGTFPDSLMAEAKQRGWTVISMKKDWKRIFEFEK